MNRLELHGCQPQPLLSYLKALGVFRLVGEQADDQASARWGARGLELQSLLDREALEEFFLRDYVPTPIVAPWNRGSGFFLHKGKTPEKLLSAVREASDERLAPLHAAIEVGLELHALAEQRGWDVNKDKERWVTFCRNRMPEQAVAWLDAATVLAEEGIVFPILLGSGGNLGRLDLTHNWLQHLVTVLGVGIQGRDPDPERSERLLRDALAGTATDTAERAAVGQFDPGRAGGENMARRHTGGRSSVNPWDFVLALEGTPLLAAGVARRSGSQGGRKVAAMPFTVYSSGVGHSDTAAGETSSGELWLPLWNRVASLEEVRRLFAEARAQWDGRQAMTGLDFVQAVTSLGADRGIDAFQRYDLVQRLGQSDLAVPAGRIRVRDRPEAGLLAPIDRWAGRVERSSELPGAVEQDLRAVRGAQFEVAASGGAERLWDLLGAVAGLQRSVSRSGSTRGRVDPIRGLDPGSWLPLLEVEGEEEELAVAVGLASLHDPVEHTGGGDPAPHNLASFLLPLAGSDRNRAWTNHPPVVEGFRTRALASVLADVAVRRSMGERHSSSDDARIELLGVEPWFTFGRPVRDEFAEVFAAGRLDDRRIEEMLDALLLLGWDWDQPRPDHPSSAGSAPLAVAPLWRLLAPFFAASAIRVRAGGDDWRDELRLRPPPRWASQLAARNLSPVARSAVQRLRVAGLQPLPQDVRLLSTGVDAHQSAAALLLHLTARDVRDLLDATTANLAEVLGQTMKEIA